VTQLATSHLEANLAALSRASPDAVARVRAAAPRPDLQFLDTPDGVPTAQIGSGAEARLLASRRRPLDEAEKLIATIDIKNAAVFVVAGFSMGYHVAALSRKLGRTGIVFVFEPDAALLRAVLERVDCTAWINAGNVCILTEPDDGAAMGQALRGLEGLVGLGVTLVQHPPSAARLGPDTRRFQERFAGIIDAVKMTVITTLVQVRVTMRNLMQNADVYAARSGIAELAGACAGRPAIVVSAGPSLQRNIVLLENPAVRERCVIVAVQTVLRTLLARGIKPHFVTALDHSEINRRFYEGLTREQVEGITLVVEPKVNPSVPMAWPGTILCTGDATLDLMLGDSLARDHGKLKQGATVAHLAYYLARHLGCNPVALIGQDLGFTDGQYYAAGAAIHGVWAGEINEFKSLELLEWHRIVRMGTHLRRAVDTLGRPMFTDAQMHSYLSQFETDFRDDAARGMTTLDATEGGVCKQHAAPIPLLRFLDEHAQPGGPPIDSLLKARAQPAPGDDPARRTHLLMDLRTRVVQVRGQIARVEALSKRAAVTLAEMREHRADQHRVNRLIDKVHADGSEVQKLTPGFNLTQLLGQATVFNRVRADRLIQLEENLGGHEIQALQIDRDIANVRGLERAAGELLDMLDGCLVVLDGGERVTRDLPKNEQELEREAHAAREGTLPARPAPIAPSVVDAIVPIDLRRGGLGSPRSLAGAFAGRRSVLAATVDRLLACAELRRITLVGDDAPAIEDLLEPRQIAGGRVRIERSTIAPDERRRRAIGAARLWAGACWRGGLGDLTVFDEAFDPRTCSSVLDRIGADAALLVGPDWAAVDPSLCAQIIRRHNENPKQNRISFTQAVPGLCGCVISRELAGELCKGDHPERLVFASLGGVLGYIPVAPLQDLIAHPICIGLFGPVRDCGLRLIADSPSMRTLLDRVLTNIAEGLGNPPSAEMIAAEVGRAMVENPAVANELVIARDGLDVGALVRQHGAARPDATVTFGDGRWEPLSRPELFEWIGAAKGAGIAGVHVRTRLPNADDAALRRLIACGVEIISVDCHGADGGLPAARERVTRLMAARREAVGDDGMGVPWIVPRLARCDDTYGDVEEFVNGWVMECGWAALDPADTPRPGERITPLPLPASASERMRRTRRFA
jgi:hypothetical protein